MLAMFCFLKNKCYLKMVRSVLRSEEPWVSPKASSILQAHFSLEGGTALHSSRLRSFFFWNRDLPASASCVLELKVCASSSGSSFFMCTPRPPWLVMWLGSLKLQPYNIILSSEIRVTEKLLSWAFPYSPRTQPSVFVAPERGIWKWEGGVAWAWEESNGMAVWTETNEGTGEWVVCSGTCGSPAEPSDTGPGW